MAIDKHIDEAIRKATSELGQQQQLADKLIAWLNALAQGNESLEDRDAVSRRLELLFNAISVNLDDLQESEEH